MKKYPLAGIIWLVSNKMFEIIILNLINNKILSGDLFKTTDTETKKNKIQHSFFIRNKAM